MKKKKKNSIYHDLIELGEKYLSLIFLAKPSTVSTSLVQYATISIKNTYSFFLATSVLNSVSRVSTTRFHVTIFNEGKKRKRS